MEPDVRDLARQDLPQNNSEAIDIGLACERISSSLILHDDFGGDEAGRPNEGVLAATATVNEFCQPKVAELQ